MAIDIRQFHQTFFEESLESIGHMEAQLLALEAALEREGGSLVAETHREEFNTIFRGAHSIKGAAGTFGFGDIADFTHLLETLLDALREGRRALNSTLAATLLQASDCLRAMIQAARAGEDINDDLKARLGVVRAALGSADDAPMPVAQSAAQKVDRRQSYCIAFKPHRGFFQTGNDPLRIIRELAELGELKARVDVAALPDFAKLEPETCYLAWTLDLDTDKPRAAIDDIFAWVIGDADLSIETRSVESGTAKKDNGAASGERGTPQQGSIRVSIPKVDALVDLVGELVITQSMLNQLAARLGPDLVPELFAGLSQLERNTRELQESVMSIRMLPIGYVFNRLPRTVRDLGRQLGKKVELQISGERTELDKTVIERISDPLMHMVRNCLDHGIEPPAQRRAAGKPETAVIRLDACQKGGNVVVEIADDGQGVDLDKVRARAIERGLLAADSDFNAEQLMEMIFLPGFSTAETVTDVSGRGVGMDVVRNNIRGLGGNVEITSQPGKGTRFVIRLPLTLAIVDGLSVSVGNRLFILPLVSIVESIRITEAEVSRPAGGPEVFAQRNSYLPVIRLHRLFGVEPRAKTLGEGILVIVEADGKKAGVFVDELLDQQQVVIKSLDAHYQRVEGVAAATILGDGTVALILDIGTLTRQSYQPGGRVTVPGLGHPPAMTSRPPAVSGGHFARS